MPENEAAGGPRGGRKKTQPLFQNKQVLMIGGIVLAALVVLGISTIFVLNRPATKPVTAESGNAEEAPGDEAEVLPQTRRDNGETQSMDVFFRDPFASPLKLTGIVTGGSGGAMAIIESSGTTYVVTAGDVINEFWTVLTISQEAVLLNAGDREVNLRLHHRAVEEQGGEEPGEAAEEDAE